MNIKAAFKPNAGFERMVELVTLLKGDGSDISIAKTLKENLPQVFGYIFPLMESESGARKTLGHEIEEAVLISIYLSQR